MTILCRVLNILQESENTKWKRIDKAMGASNTSLYSISEYYISRIIAFVAEHKHEFQENILDKWQFYLKIQVYCFARISESKIE